jgi:CelD/BcsL family acetyltransferase involved in cellulose biosynthesis
MTAADTPISTATIAATAPVGLTAQVSPGLDALPSLEQEWRRLFERTVSEPAMSFEWTQALARTQIDRGDACCIVQIRREKELVGVVPLYVRATRVLRQRHFVMRPLAELKNTHSDLLFSDTSADTMAAFLGALRLTGCRWDSLRLSKLLEGHALTPLLEQAATAQGYAPRRRFRKAAYWLPLPGSLAEYLAARSHKFRNYARRAEKKLRAAGRVETIEVTTPGEFDAAYEALLQVERASWKEANGTSISADRRQAALYRDWGRAGAAAGHLHLQLLTLNGEPIAHNLGAIHRGTYYYLKTSYAARYRPLSPATFLRLALIESMIGRGFTAIDFCGTPYEWEQQWTDRYRWHHVLSIYAPTLRGRMLSVLDPWTHYSSSGTTIEHEDPRSEKA